VSAIVLDSTDMVVLSVFSDMYAVSIYSVYLLVVSGIQKLVLRFFSGVNALFGELWAKQEREELNRYFALSEWLIHGISLFVWCCTYKLIVPFVLIYTEHISHTNYNVPGFAALLCTAYALHCLRLPFNTMILAAGHYRNTQGIYIVGALLNLILSVIAVSRWGLIGVTVGTVVAILYQVIHMGYYVIKRLNVHSFRRSVKQCVFDIVNVILILCVTSGLSYPGNSWGGWVMCAVKHAVVIAVCLAVTNFTFYNKESMQMVRKVLRKK
jgi:O-antigen/teichoic acid export membrane protein